MAEEIRNRSEQRGFWIPDEVATVLVRMDSHAFVLYGMFGLCLSLSAYPSTMVVASLLKISEEQVWDLLQEMYDNGILNDSDIRAIHVACQKEACHNDYVNRDCPENQL